MVGIWFFAVICSLFFSVFGFGWILANLLTFTVVLVGLGGFYWSLLFVLGFFSCGRCFGFLVF